MKAISLFSSAGVGEYYLKDIGIDVVIANEINEKRANFYSHLHPESKMIKGDIQQSDIKKEIKNELKKHNDLKMLIATPPCQGVSTLGKNKLSTSFGLDKRNYLIFDTIDVINMADFDYVLIENVARFKDMYFPYDDKMLSVFEIFKKIYSEHYTIKLDIFNAKDFGVPQTRPRYILRMFKKYLNWPEPTLSPEITLRESIGHLPTLESGEKSTIERHYAKKHNDRDVLAMKHTPTGKSALLNKVYYPKRLDGVKIKGFHNTYKRLDWDKPCHARTTNSGNIGSHNNVHPGRKLKDGTYSDARVLTIYELLIVSSLPVDWSIPVWSSDNLVRQVLGECIPPLMMKKILINIKKI